MNMETSQRKEEKKNNNQNNHDTSSSSSLVTICQLISFLITNIVKTETEWKDWGKPFVQLIFSSQFTDPKEGIQLFEEFQQQFFPIIGHGVALWIEETITATHSKGTSAVHPDSPQQQQLHLQQGIDDYVIISSLEERLTKVLANYLLFSSKEMEETLIQFFTKFYQYLEKIDHYYDSRERDIAKKVCSILNLSAHQLSDLEKELLAHPTDIDGSSDLFPSEVVPAEAKNYPVEENNHLFLTLFHQHSQTIPRESLLVSYRMWRVAFVAAGGGAMVGMAGFIAAPSIVSTVIPVLCNAATFTQLSVTLDTFLSYVGILTYPLIPGIFSTYGATIAGTVMMKRTAAIKDFELQPLHIHNKKIRNNTELYSKKDKTGIPIFILVNGHVEKNVDPRIMWGANGTDIIMSEQTITTVITPSTVERVEEIVVEKNHLDDTDTGILSSTLKELQEELLEESKLIAETIQQSIQGVSSFSKENFSNQHSPLLHNEEDTTVTLASAVATKGESTNQDETKELHEWEELDYSYSIGWWKEIIPFGEEYVLSWENDLLSHLTESFLSMIKHKISSTLISHLKEFFYQQITPLHAIQKSIGLPNLALAKIKQLDDVWVIAMDRALQGGKLLAKILLKQFQPLLQKQRDVTVSDQSAGKKEHSLRPVTLIGYGMGARLIYHCLETLLQESQQFGGEEAIKGIIENVVLIGTPIKIDLAKFQSFRNIVSSRFINCYSRYDWILALLYRSKAYEYFIAGLYPIYLPGQHHQPTHVASQKATLFIQKIDTNDQQSSLSIELGEFPGEVESKKDELLQEKEKEISSKLFQLKEEHQFIENYDITDLVYLQTDYPKVLPAIMKLINLQQL